MAIYDPNKKKPLVAPTYPQQLGAVAGQTADTYRHGVGAVTGAIGNGLTALDHAVGQTQTAGNQALREASASFSASAPAVPKPAPTYNGPLLAPSSMAPAAPANAYNFMDGQAVAPATHPASSASQAGASAPAGGVAAPFRGQFNDGSGATFRTGDGRTGQLPAGVAVVRQKNGVNAFGATGASVAAATGNAPTTLAPPSTVSAPNLNVPALDLPSVNTQRVTDAARERTAAQSQIGSDLFAAGLRQPSRGQRAQIADLQGQRNRLVEQSGALAGDAANQTLQSATQAGTAVMGQNAENQRALLNEQGANSRFGLQNATDLYKTNLDANKPTYQNDASGNVNAVSGTSFTPVADAKGNPLKAPTTKDQTAASPDAILSAYNAQLKAISDSAALTGKAPDFSALESSPLGQRAQQVIGTAGNSMAPSEPPAAAIADLKANPALAAKFDQTFGKGAAARYVK